MIRHLRSFLTACAFGLAAFTAGIGTAAAQNAGNDQVVAVVNGEKILLSDFNAAFQTLPERLRSRGPEAVYPQVLERLIQQSLIVKLGREANLAEDDEVKARLRTLESKVIHDVYLSREVAKRLSEEELRAAYDGYIAQNPPQEKVRASHILVKTEEEARKLILLIGQGQPFADLARQHSTGPSRTNGGDLGFFARGAMVKEFEDAAFGLQPNTYTADPIQTQFGWHVILVTDRQTDEVPSFEQMRPRIVARMNQEKALAVYEDLVNAADVQRFGMDGSPMAGPSLSGSN